MIPGRTFNLNGDDYTIAPLTMRQMRDLQEDINKIGGILADGEEALTADQRTDLILKVIAAALSRNHDGITADKMLDLVDVGNIGDVFNAALAVSGLVSGEATPAASAA